MTDLPSARRTGHADAASWTQHPLVRLAALLAVVLVAVVVVVLLRPTSDELRGTVDRAGPAGPVLFVLAYGLITLAPLPKAFLSVAGGILYGLAVGCLLVLIGAVLGAVLAFALGRRLGREAVERFTGARVARIDALLRDRGLLAVISLRLVPVAPFTAINYAAGLSAVRVRDYVLGTAVGVLPGTVSYVAIGAYGLDAVSSPYYLAAVAVGLTGVVAVVWVRTVRRRRTRRAG